MADAGAAGRVAWVAPAAARVVAGYTHRLGPVVVVAAVATAAAVVAVAMERVVAAVGVLAVASRWHRW